MRRSSLVSVSLLVLVAIVFLLSYIVLSMLSFAPMSPEEYAEYKHMETYCSNRSSATRNKEHAWPKILHQIWLEGDVPARFKRMIDDCKRLNRHYDYKLWSDKDIKALIDRHYGWFSETYSSYPYWVQKTDSGRLFIMHHYGGAFLDVDMECKTPFREIHRDIPRGDADHSVILARTDPIGITSNMQIVKPRALFYEFLTKRLLKTKGTYLSPHWTVMFTAGPLFLYRSYLKYPCKDDVHLLSVYEHDFVYFHHVQATSWHQWDGPIIYWFDYNGRKLLYVLAVAAALVAFCSCKVLLSRFLIYWKSAPKTEIRHGDL